MKITRYPKEFGCYRYKLRVEEIDLSGKANRGEVVFVMFNPATTSEERDLGTGSHTRRRCIKFARDEGYGSLTEVNLFAFRSPKKDDLYKAVIERNIDVVGPENDQVIRNVATEADMIVVAWGNIDGRRRFREWANERTQEIAEFLMSLDKQVYCIGKNSDGSPKHPSRGSYILQPWP